MERPARRLALSPQPVLSRALRAAHRPPVPVHGEVGDEEGAFRLGSASSGPGARADQVDAVPLAGRDEVLGADIGGVDQVLGRRQPLGGERGVDRLGAHGLVDVGRRRVGVQHQARRARVAGLGEVDHVAGPVRAALGPEAGLGVVGGLDPIAGTAALHGPQPCAAAGRLRHRRRRIPARRARSAAPTRGAARRPRAALDSLGRRVRARRAHPAAGSRPRRPGPRRRRAWARSRAGACPRPGGRSACATRPVPGHAASRAPPRRSRSARRAASRPAARSGSGRARRPARACCRCAAGPAPSAAQPRAPRPARGRAGARRPRAPAGGRGTRTGRCGRSRGRPGPGRAGTSSRSGPHRLGRLPVAQPLAELHQRDQRQPPRRIGRLAEGGVEVAEAGIVEHRTEPVAQEQVGVAARERRSGDAGGVVGNRRDTAAGGATWAASDQDHPSTPLASPAADFANSVRRLVGPDPLMADLRDAPWCVPPAADPRCGVA